MSSTVLQQLFPEDMVLSPQVVTLVVTAAVAILVVTQILSFTAFGSKSDPKLPPYASTGLLELVKQLTGNETPDFIEGLSHQFGNVFRFKVPMANVVVVGQPGLLRDILSDAGSIKPALVYAPIGGITKGIANMLSDCDVDHVKMNRKGIMAAFSGPHIKRMNEVGMKTLKDWLKSTLEPKIACGEAFNPGDELVDVMIRAVCLQSFEYDPSPKEIASFQSNLDISIKEFLLRRMANPLRGPFSPLLKFFNEEIQEANTAVDDLEAFALRMMEDYRKHKASRTKNTAMDIIMNSPMFTTDAERACEVITYLWGSHDTQAHTIAWILKYITRDTSEQTKLREDLLAISNSQDRPQKSKVLNNVLQEGLRIAPVASVFSFRQTGRDFMNPADNTMIVPKNSICMMALTVAHHDKNVWGEDALEFRADRWNAPTEMQKDAFTPFNLGSRNCPGQKLAKSQLLTMMAHMFANYEFELVQEGTSDFFGTYKPKDLLVKAHKVAK